MDKDLEWNRGIAEAGEFAQGKFAGEHGAVESQFVHEGEAFRRGDGHLGTRVEFERGSHGSCEPGEADILNDDGIDARLGEEAELGGGGWQFLREDEGIHGHEAADAAVVQEPHHFREVGFREIIGAEPGIEARQAEVHCVRSIGDGGAHAFKIPGWGEEFRGLGGRAGRRHLGGERVVSWRSAGARCEPGAWWGPCWPGRKAWCRAGRDRWRPAG